MNMIKDAYVVLFGLFIFASSRLSLFNPNLILLSSFPPLHESTLNLVPFFFFFYTGISFFVVDTNLIGDNNTTWRGYVHLDRFDSCFTRVDSNCAIVKVWYEKPIRSSEIWYRSNIFRLISLWFWKLFFFSLNLFLIKNILIY